MTVRLVYFAGARDLAETDSETLDYDAAGLDEEGFKRWLGERKPRLAAYLPRMRLAVNGEFAQAETRIVTGDEVSVLPPVAGGSEAPLAEVRSEPLSIDEVYARVRHPTAGGICIFLGVVRDHHEGKPVARLDYEAYAELANKDMARILREVMEETPGVRVAAVHRVGELAIGDAAVIVAASSAHRAEAFAACRKVIDLIKDTTPIWKKEWDPDGQALWVNLEADERK